MSETILALAANLAFPDPAAGSTLVPVVATAVAAACLVEAAVTDLATRQIPDHVSLLVALAGAVALGFLPGPAVATALLMAATVGGLGVIAWRYGLFGGGDVKLAAALGLWLGTDTLGLFLFGLLLAILLSAPLFLLARHLGRQRGRTLPPALADPGYPFGIALAGGGLLLLAERAGLVAADLPWT